MAEKLRLGDRVFEPVAASTLAHDLWFMRQIEASGLHEHTTKRDDETDLEYARRLLDVCLRSDRALLLLAGCMQPEGVAWSEQNAKETAAYLGALTSDDDKQAVKAEFLSLLMSFFRVGLLSSKSSRSSSTKDGERPRRGSNAPTASGRRSSARSEATITRAASA